MHINIPKTLLGRWSVGLCIVSIILFALFSAILGPGPDCNRPLAYSCSLCDISSHVFNRTPQYNEEKGAVYSCICGHGNWLMQSYRRGYLAVWPTEVD
jgi:hypothetical protein